MMNCVRIAGNGKPRNRVALIAAGLAVVALAGPMPSKSPESRGMPARALDDGEFMVDTSFSVGTALGNQNYAAVSRAGTTMLVVWQDSRTGPDNIRGARVTQDGAVQDSLGILISPSSSAERRPAIASDGVGFLVVWTDLRTGSWEVRASRVTAQGVVLDTQGIVISSASGYEPQSAVVFDGTDYLVVWEGSRDSVEGVYAARVTPLGQLVDSVGVLVSRGAQHPAAAFDGTCNLIAWDDTRGGVWEVYATRMTPQMQVLDTSGILVHGAPNHAWNPAAGSDGTGFLVAWEDSRPGYYHTIYCARVRQDGKVLDSAGFAASTAECDKQDCAIGWDGLNYFVTWTDNRGTYLRVYGTRVSPAGVVMDSAGLCISYDCFHQEDPAVAFDGVNLLVAWSGLTAWAGEDVFCTRVTPEGTVPDTQRIAVSFQLDWQWYPAAAYDGSNFLVVWQDHRVTWDIYGARVSPDGRRLDPRGIPISTAPLDQGSVAVGRGTSNSLVAWTDGRNLGGLGVYAARVMPDGTVPDTAGIAVKTGGTATGPAVGSDGSNFLVVWGQNWRIFGARVTPDGAVLDSESFTISNGPDDYGASVGFDGTNYLVVWTGGSPNLREICGARVQRDGTVLDHFQITNSAGMGGRWGPRVDSDSAGFLVVWTDERGGSRDIYGARVTSDGTVLDSAGIAISASSGTEALPAVCFDGTNFQVVWLDSRGDSSDIFGAVVTPEGVVLDRGQIVAQPGAQKSPALAHGAGNQLFLAYQSWTEEAEGRSYNDQRIWGRLGPLGGVAQERRGALPGCLLSVAPNPLTSAASVMYTLSRPGNVSQKLYNVAGKLVGTLASGYHPAGCHAYRLSPTAYRLSAGVYILKFETEGYRVTEKLVVE